MPREGALCRDCRNDAEQEHDADGGGLVLVSSRGSLAPGEREAAHRST